MEQLILHLVGDYLLQSDWMAQEKRRSSWAAFAHALTYSLPFLLLGAWAAVAFILVTHFLIDRFGLARYVVWAKNWLAPFQWHGLPGTSFESEDCQQEIRPGVWAPAQSLPFYVFRPTLPWRYCTATGYSPDRPVWLATWLLIIADNTLHLICNYFALRWL